MESNAIVIREPETGKLIALLAKTAVPDILRLNSQLVSKHS